MNRRKRQDGEAAGTYKCLVFIVHDPNTPGLGVEAGGPGGAQGSIDGYKQCSGGYKTLTRPKDQMVYRLMYTEVVQQP